jgi:hypothetical protein
MINGTFYTGTCAVIKCAEIGFPSLPFILEMDLPPHLNTTPLIPKLTQEQNSGDGESYVDVVNKP